MSKQKKSWLALATGEVACKLGVKVTDEAGYQGDLETAILLQERGT